MSPPSAPPKAPAWVCTICGLSISGVEDLPAGWNALLLACGYYPICQGCIAQHGGSLGAARQGAHTKHFETCSLCVTGRK